MSLEDDIAAALIDHVHQQVEHVERAANDETFKVTRADAFHSSTHLRLMATAYRDGMRSLAETARHLLTAIEGAAAGNSAEILEDALRNGGAALTDS